MVETAVNMYDDMHGQGHSKVDFYNTTNDNHDWTYNTDLSYYWYGQVTPVAARNVDLEVVEVQLVNSVH